MVRFILMMAGVLFTLCSSVGVVMALLRVDYGIEPHDSITWLELGTMMMGVPLAALMFTAATSDRKRPVKD